jgi:hypothetical protein
MLGLQTEMVQNLTCSASQPDLLGPKSDQKAPIFDLQGRSFDRKASASEQFGEVFQELSQKTTAIYAKRPSTCQWPDI